MKPTKDDFYEWCRLWVSTRQMRGIKIDYREYQSDKLYEIITGNFRKFVLCCCPNAGKTLISIMLLDWFYHVNPMFKAVVLTHGIDELRRQFRASVIKYEPDFARISAQSEWNTMSINKKMKYIKTGMGDNIIIDLPQSVKKRKQLGKVDLVIVDEAHHFYFAKMVEDIIKDVKPDMELLLTATPSVFIMYNKENKNLDGMAYHISYLSIYELWKIDFMQDVLVEVASTNYHINWGEDYNAKGDLTGKNKLTEKQVRSAMSQMMIKIMKRLRSRLKMHPELLTNGEQALTALKMYDGIQLFPKDKEKIGKTMICCRNKKEAGWIHEFLEKEYGYSKENICQCTYDRNDVPNLMPFKEDPKVRFAIVIYKGILGFDMADMENIIDITGSRNINRIFQLYCRLIRQSTTVTDKFYYKLVPDELVYFFKKFMAAVLHLSHTKFISEFDGKNFYDMPILLKEPMVKPHTPSLRNLMISNTAGAIIYTDDFQVMDEMSYNSTLQGRYMKEGWYKIEGTDGWISADDIEVIRNETSPRAIKGLSLQCVFDLIPMYHMGDRACDSKAFITLRQVMRELDMAVQMNWKIMSDDEKMDWLAEHAKGELTIK